MKTPTWQVSTLPRWPHHWRLTPTECVPRFGKLLGSEAMMPSGGADEVLDHLSFDIDPRRDVLGILAGQVGQQPLEVEGPVVLAGRGLQRSLIRHNEVAQPLHHGGEYVGG